MIRTISSRTESTPSFPFADLNNRLRRAFQINPWLSLFGLLSGAAAFVIVGLALVDPRLVSGSPVWIKPLKFAISLSINAFTILWMLHFVRDRARWITLAANAIAIGSLVELVIIAGQAARGVGSHFNVATPLDAFLFATMGVFVYFIWCGMLLTAILIMFQRFENPTFAWALRLGLIITLAGGFIGNLMVSPTQAQLAQAEATGLMAIAGAHSVGVSDGGAGLPFLGWSTGGGDLRAAHFFGLHGIQFLAVTGGLLALWRRRWLSNRHRVAMIWVLGLGYAGFVGTVLWQALRAEPLVAPGALTLATWAGTAGFVLLGLGGILLHARSQESVSLSEE